MPSSVLQGFIDKGQQLHQMDLIVRCGAHKADLHTQMWSLTILSLLCFSESRFQREMVTLYVDLDTT